MTDAAECAGEVTDGPYYALRVLAQVRPGESVLVRRCGRVGGGSATGSAVGIGGFATASRVSGTRCTQWDVTTRMLPIHALISRRRFG